MTSEKRRLYPRNWQELARRCKQRAGWQCEHCKVDHLATRLSRKGKLYTVYLAAAHKNHDPDNPAPELVALCVTCHARYDYKHKQREKMIALHRLKHQRLIA